MFKWRVFILDEIGIRGRFDQLQRCSFAEYPNSVVSVSYKTNPTLLKLLHEDGAIAEVVSGNEYRIARSLNVPANQIIFNWPCKSDEDP